jgi:hypothetical protein
MHIASLLYYTKWLQRKEKEREAKAMNKPPTRKEQQQKVYFYTINVPF